MHSYNVLLCFFVSNLMLKYNASNSFSQKDIFFDQQFFQVVFPQMGRVTKMITFKNKWNERRYSLLSLFTNTSIIRMPHQSQESGKLVLKFFDFAVKKCHLHRCLIISLRETKVSRMCEFGVQNWQQSLS